MSKKNHEIIINLSVLTESDRDAIMKVLNDRLKTIEDETNMTAHWILYGYISTPQTTTDDTGRKLPKTIT